MKIPGIVFNKQITCTCVLFVSDLDSQKDRYLKDVYGLKGYKRNSLDLLSIWKILIKKP